MHEKIGNLDRVSVRTLVSPEGRSLLMIHNNNHMMRDTQREKSRPITIPSDLRKRQSASLSQLSQCDAGNDPGDLRGTLGSNRARLRLLREVVVETSQMELLVRRGCPFVVLAKPLDDLMNPNRILREIRAIRLTSKPVEQLAVLVGMRNNAVPDSVGSDSWTDQGLFRVVAFGEEGNCGHQSRRHAEPRHHRCKLVHFDEDCGVFPSRVGSFPIGLKAAYDVRFRCTLRGHTLACAFIVIGGVSCIVVPRANWPENGVWYDCQ